MFAFLETRFVIAIFAFFSVRAFVTHSLPFLQTGLEIFLRRPQSLDTLVQEVIRGFCEESAQETSCLLGVVLKGLDFRVLHQESFLL